MDIQLDMLLKLLIEAVANGMVYECFIAYKLGLCEIETYERIKKVINSFNFSQIKGKKNIEKIIENLKYDKKVRKGRVRFVLPEKIGKVKRGVIAGENTIRKILKEIEENG